MSEIVSPFSKSIIIVEDQLLFKSISTLEFGQVQIYRQYQHMVELYN